MSSHPVVDTSRSPHAAHRPVPMDAVRLSDAFLEPRRAINRTTTIPSQYAHLESTNRLRNFRRVVENRPDIPFEGIYFNDSDVYKWLEAAASTLADPALEDRAELDAQVETVASLIEGAQSPDGYLSTYFAFERTGERYTNLRDMHELYCIGHFVQAAVAHYRATGSERLLTVARRVADHLDATFGDPADGKRHGTDGHEEIELALAELFRATGEARYLRLAEYFVSARGQSPSACTRADGNDHDRRYRQDHVPYRELREVTGHAVRMLYLAAGATDLLLEAGDAALLDAVIAQWCNMTERRSYVSGGVGARWEGEAFGTDYELPADRAYTETCAAIASVMWNHRLLLLTGDSQYADLLEHTLYNAVLPGLSLSGDEYFYQNPLDNDGTHRRQKWFGCACCPPNVARLLAQLPGYLFTTDRATGDVCVSLYADCRAEIVLASGETVSLTVQTEYPYGDGTVTVTLQDPADSFGLRLRVPAWVTGATITTAQGTRPASAGTFERVAMTGVAGETVTLHLPLDLRQVVAHPYATDAGGRVALFRGALLYCAEAADNPGWDVRDLAIPANATVAVLLHSDLPGVRSLMINAATTSPAHDALYVARESVDTMPLEPVTATLIPYYAWANRAPGAMRVWLRQDNRS